MFKKKEYSLFKCKKIFRHILSRYKNKKKTLDQEKQMRFEELLKTLQKDLLQKDKKAANRACKSLESLTNTYLKKTIFEKFADSFLALLFAVVFAIFIRQIFFEPMIIPTGSMRPTLKEKDILLVTKTNYSLNVPLQTKHFFFKDELLKRGSIVVFTSKNLDIQDPNMLYFYIFPGKKQLVKRLIAKPGDILYFYGGQIYGIDKDENTILEYQKYPWFTDLEHIPYIKYDGKIVSSNENNKHISFPIISYQMNEPLAMLNLSSMGQLQAELTYDQSNAFSNEAKIDDYYQIWGFENYAMTRLLTKNEAMKFSDASLANISRADYYLELTHHPSIKDPKIIKDDRGILRPALNTTVSLIPLDEKSMQKIFQSMYTARFCVKKGYVYNFGSQINRLTPKIDNIKDGCYEIQDGIAYSVNSLGIIKKLDNNHPLNQFSFYKTHLFYNLGINFNTLFNPYRKNQTIVPYRYAYFRDENLYLMNHKIFEKEDPVLLEFISKENSKKQSLITQTPFEDLKPNIDKEFIKKYGIKIPDNMYLVLGDNHAMSADSRDFGFVPKENLKGGVNFILWPPSKRWGKPFGPSFTIINPANIIVILSIIIVSVTYVIVLRRKIKKPLKF